MAEGPSLLDALMGRTLAEYPELNDPEFRDFTGLSLRPGNGYVPDISEL